MSAVFSRLVPCCLCLVLGACSPVGEEYADVDAVAMSETWRDWVVVGRFGPTVGPFELTELKFCDVNERCSFSHQGQGHTYSGFDGFALRVLRLEHVDNAGVTHVVLRGAEPVD